MCLLDFLSNQVLEMSRHTSSLLLHQNLITCGKQVPLLTPPSFLYHATSQTATLGQERQDINTTCAHTLGSGGWRWAQASICSLLSLWQLITSRWKPHRCLTSQQPLSPPPPTSYPFFLPTLQPPSRTPCVSSFTPDLHYTRYFTATKRVLDFAAPALFIYLSLSPLLALLFPPF